MSLLVVVNRLSDSSVSSLGSWATQTHIWTSQSTSEPNRLSSPTTRVIRGLVPARMVTKLIKVAIWPLNFFSFFSYSINIPIHLTIFSHANNNSYSLPHSIIYYILPSISISYYKFTILYSHHVLYLLAYSIIQITIHILHIIFYTPVHYNLRSYNYQISIYSFDISSSFMFLYYQFITDGFIIIC